MKLQSVPAGPFGTNMYILSNDENTHCIIVDAPPGVAGTLRNYLDKNGLTLDAILITHGHWDHNGGVAPILAGEEQGENRIPVFAHNDGIELHEHPEKFSAWYQSIIPGLDASDFPAFKLTRPVADDERFELLGKEWRALHVPGHCPGSLAFYCESEAILFTGDTLFAGSIGRTDLPGGSFSTLEKAILNKIFTLPREVKVFPGHGQSTSVGEEIDTNPYIRI